MCVVRDVGLVGRENERRGDGDEGGTHQRDLPDRRQAIGRIGHQAGQTAQNDRSEPADGVRKPAPKDAKQEREDERDREKETDLTNVGAQLAQEHRYLDHGQCAGGFHEEHSRQE